MSVDLSPVANAAVVGQPGFVIHGSNWHGVVRSVRNGVAMLWWWDPNFYAGPCWRGQAFRADRVTSSPIVAAASIEDLRAAGWNI